MSGDLEPALLQRVRAVADAVLYEGYLLYPYRSTSGKNQVRWQFGVLGPPGAAAGGLGEEPALRTECLVRPGPDPSSARLGVRLRLLQVQARTVQAANGAGWRTVDRLEAAGTAWVTWDEALAHELALGPFALDELRAGVSVPVDVPGGEDIEPLPEARAGRIVRRREPLRGVLELTAVADGDLVRVAAEVRNTGAAAADRAQAARRSFTGTHLVLTVAGAAFVSVIDPPEDALAAAARCTQRRCWPVLAGPAEEDRIVLAAPIILYDHPEIAPQSAGDLFDATEIDEILTLRVLTMTDREKAEARATDPRAAAIIDRCEAMSPADLQRLHGVLRDPHAGTATLTGDDWWQAEAAAAVTPETDCVLVAGVAVRGGSLVRLRPSRRADAQDIFLAGRTARVSAVHTDLDGVTHVAVSLVDDPAAEFHDWYGRHLFFAPDELEPLGPAGTQSAPREENQP